MKRTRILVMAFAIIFLAALAAPALVGARDITPIVSLDWLEKNLGNPKVRIIDIRKVEEYRAGHVPNALNVFYGTWAVAKKGLANELPEADDLVDAISSAGIAPDSWVILTGSADALPDRMRLTRVAWTLAYAGIANVAILDGGYGKWVAAKKPVSTDLVRPVAAAFKPDWNKRLLVARDGLISDMGKAILVDARLPDAYFGVTKLDITARYGHIKSALCLPSAWLYGKDNTFISKGDLEAMATGVVGNDKSKEVIVYCDTGLVASGWWYVLSEVLGYKNVRLYDGSSQEWAKDPNMPMTIFSWK